MRAEQADTIKFIGATKKGRNVEETADHFKVAYPSARSRLERLVENGWAEKVEAGRSKVNKTTYRYRATVDGKAAAKAHAKRA